MIIILFFVLFIVSPFGHIIFLFHSTFGVVVLYFLFCTTFYVVYSNIILNTPILQYQKQTV